MKKFLLISIIAFFTVKGVSAQETKSDYTNVIHFGFKVGVNRSNIYDSKTQDFSEKPKFGFAGGAFIDIPLGKYFGIQPEVMFSQKGFKASGEILGQSYNFTRNLNFIDVPIFLAIKPSLFVTILAGPQLSYLISQKDVFENTLYSSSQEQQFQNTNLRKNILCFVGGLDFNLAPAVIGARVGWDLQRNNGDGSSSEPTYKNAWLQLTLGFRF